MYTTVATLQVPADMGVPGIQLFVVAGQAVGAACAGGPLGLAAGCHLHCWHCHLHLPSLQIHCIGKFNTLARPPVFAV